MKAKSQEYNDNIGNDETELCFECKTYKTKDEFNTPEGKNICVECYNEYLELCKNKGVTFIEVAGRKIRSLTMGEYELTDVYCVLQGKKIFIRGYNPKEDRQSYNFVSHEKAEIFELKMQFLKSNLGFFSLHCGAWTDLKETDKTPINFVKWIKENGYNFGKDYDVEIEYLEHYDLFDFAGNLDNLSCAFNFRIYDREYLKELLQVLKDSYYKNIKIKIKEEIIKQEVIA